VYQVVVLFVVVGTAIPVFLHHAAHGRLNVHQIGLAFFLWLNTLIALWELCLLRHIRRIHAEYKTFRAHYRGREIARVFDLFGKRIRFGQVFSSRTWAEVWSSYALFDESYADSKSYGFFIDVGNGITTLIPSVLFVYGMTFEWLPARVLGIIGLLLNYQMWYGTLVYFGSYLYHRRYRGHPASHVALFVGLSNAIWFTFPLWAMWASVMLITNNAYTVFR
jgi:hypothetical protein